jgi:glutathione S-transferase
MVAGKREAAARTLAALDRALQGGGFLTGPNLTIADIAVYAYSHRAEDCGLNLTGYPAFTRWLDRVAEAIGPDYPVHPYTYDPHSGA